MNILEKYNLIKEWDFDKNSQVDISKLKPSSHKKYWWKCSIGHSYPMDLASRTREGKQQGCPICAGKQVLPGFNDLETTHPHISIHWDYEKNYPVTPQQVTYGSTKEYYWICPICGESYRSTVLSRTKSVDSKCLCKSCSKKEGNRKRISKLINEGNSLALHNPILAAEWHPTKNGSLTAYDVTASSGKMVWWLCHICGHEWEQTVNTRQKGEGCPKCARSFHTSFVEQSVYYYVRKMFPDAINGYRSKDIGRYTIDIFIPSLKIGIEYDGSFWHLDVGRDINKTATLNKHGISLIRLREDSLGKLEDGSYQIFVSEDYNNIEHLEPSIIELLEYLKSFSNTQNIVPNVSIHYDYHSIVSVFEKNLRGRSLQDLFPDIASEWDYDKNDLLLPTQVTAYSGLRVYWKCKTCGHSWRTDIASRASGTGCPICARERVTKSLSTRNLKKGTNDLATLRPEIAALWNYNINEKGPSDYTCSSNKTVSWICKLGHTWSAKISSMTRNNNKKESCPICSGRQVLKGFNDLATTYPDIAIDWDYEANSLLPTQVTAGSIKVVNWKCHICGHKWPTSISHRTNGSNCPKCSKKKARIKLSQKNLIPGVNDLLTLYPVLCEEWDYENNKKILGITPEQVTAKSSMNAFWICRKCHKSFRSVISNRTNGSQCTYCGKNSPRPKSVINLDTNEVFSSIKEASIAYNISPSCISDCCKGKTKTAAKHKWSFI